MSKSNSFRFILCLLFLALVSLIPSGAQSERPKNVIKASHIGTMSVVVTCANDADPTGKEIAYHTLLISCGK